MGWDENLFREAIKKKYDIAQQETNIKQQEANTGQAEQLARASLFGAQAQHYAGANDTDLAKVKMGAASELDKTRIGAAEEQRRTLAMAPMWQSNAAHAGAMAEGQNQENIFNKEINPYRIQQSVATGKLNAATYNGEVNAQEEKNYQAWKAGNLAKPEWANDPYKPAVIPERSGWLSKLWEGNLYNPLNPMVTAQQSAEDIQRKKIATANALFLQNNPEYRY
jgi:hypothetical protein